MNIEKFNKFFIDSLNKPFNNPAYKNDPLYIKATSFIINLIPLIMFIYSFNILDDLYLLVLLSFIEGVAIGMFFLYCVIKQRKQQIMNAAIIIMLSFLIFLSGIFRNGF
jgi:hypothetical protein